MSNMIQSGHKANFYSLPTESILQIASYLDVNTLWNLSRTCIFLRKIIFSSAQTLRQIILNFSDIYARRYGLHTSSKLMPIISAKCLHDNPISKDEKLTILVIGRQNSGTSTIANAVFKGESNKLRADDFQSNIHEGSEKDIQILQSDNMDVIYLTLETLFSNIEFYNEKFKNVHSIIYTINSSNSEYLDNEARMDLYQLLNIGELYKKPLLICVTNSDPQLENVDLALKLGLSFTSIVIKTAANTRFFPLYFYYPDDEVPRNIHQKWCVVYYEALMDGLIWMNTELYGADPK